MRILQINYLLYGFVCVDCCQGRNSKETHGWTWTANDRAKESWTCSTRQRKAKPKMIVHVQIMTALNDSSQEQNLAEEVRLWEVRLAAVLVPSQDFYGEGLWAG